MPTQLSFKLQIPDGEYNQAEEARFRRDLENIIVALTYEIANISFGTNTATSLYFKRGLASNLPIGITTYT